MLRGVARRLGGNCRPYDAVGRYGGEEFLVVAPGCDAGQVLGLAERLRIAVAAEAIELPEALLDITMSFGVTSFTPGSGVAAEALLRTADEALYRAKHEGRNRVRVAESPQRLAAAS